jgi:hypothetical protein
MSWRAGSRCSGDATARRAACVAIVAAGVVAVAVGLLIARSGEGAFNALFIVVAVILGGVTLNHTIRRRPNARLRVVVENHGGGDAEAVEVRFAKLGVDVYNETGNSAADIDDTVSPPRFRGGIRVLAPGESWTIALLSDSHHAGWQPGLAPWSARARNMAEQHGTVKVEVLPRAAVLNRGGNTARAATGRNGVDPAAVRCSGTAWSRRRGILRLLGERLVDGATVYRPKRQ